jgi:pyruvate/2-oxoglutarate dehydrogenase complex dihydrolipoamide dehydrogenase (E3) component
MSEPASQAQPVLPFHGDTLRDNLHPPAWRNPSPAGTYDLVVIGAGPGGLAASRAAAKLGARVALIERALIGGARLNAGCVPSKALIRTARAYAEMRDANAFGAVGPDAIRVSYPAAVARMREIQARLSRSDSAARLREAGIDVYFGEARFLAPDKVAVGGDVLHFGKALVVTGTRPQIADIPGLAESDTPPNETIFNADECPGRLLIIGGGPFGCEMAQAFCRFGVHVIIAQSDPMFLPKEERDAAQVVSDALARDGVEVHLNTTVVSVRTQGAEKIAELEYEGGTFTVSVDRIITGIGRSPNVESLNLDAAGVAYDLVAGIGVDDFLRTSNKRIYAAGDVCLEHKYAHVAEASARLATRNALLPGGRRFSAMTIPWCTYTDPEIAHVGLYVREARERDIPVRTFTILMHDVDRAVTDGEEEGFVKIHVKQGTDRILGATVVARHAGEMINGLSLAINSGIGLRALGRVVHTYPTQAEAIKMAADVYRRELFMSGPNAMTRAWLALSRAMHRWLPHRPVP